MRPPAGPMLGVSAAEGGRQTEGGGEGGGIDKVLNMQKNWSEAVWVNRPKLIIDALQTGLTRLT